MCSCVLVLPPHLPSAVAARSTDREEHSPSLQGTSIHDPAIPRRSCAWNHGSWCDCESLTQPRACNPHTHTCSAQTECMHTHCARTSRASSSTQASRIKREWQMRSNWANHRWAQYDVQGEEWPACLRDPTPACHHGLMPSRPHPFAPSLPHPFAPKCLQAHFHLPSRPQLAVAPSRPLRSSRARRYDDHVSLGRWMLGCTDVQQHRLILVTTARRRTTDNPLLTRRGVHTDCHIQTCGSGQIESGGSEGGGSEGGGAGAASLVGKAVAARLWCEG